MAPLLLARVSRVVLAAVCVGAVAGACMFAYYRMYSDFRVYDDEGNNMITAQGYMLGNPLVEEVYANYGPFLYVYHRIVHAVTGQPMTHDFNRMHILVQWMLASLLSAGIVFRLSRSWVVSGAVFLATVLHLDAVRFEPGSAQSLTVLTLLCAALAVTFIGADGTRRWAVIALGALLAAATLTKINVGAFAIVSVALMCAYTLPRDRVYVTAYIVFFLGAALLPRLLIGPKAWSGEAEMSYPAIVSLGVVSIGLAGARPSGSEFLSFRSIPWIACAFVVIACAIVLSVVLGGTSVASLVDAIWTRPLSRAESWIAPLNLESGVLRYAWISLAVAAVSSVRHRFPPKFALVWNVVLTVLKATLAWYVVSAACRLDEQTLRHAYVRFVPWYWLVLVGPVGDDENNFTTSAGRFFLAALGTLAIMQIYPAAATHAVMATVFAVPIAGVLAWDVVRSAVAAVGKYLPAADGIGPRRLPALRSLGRAAALAMIALVFASTSTFGDVRARYWNRTPLELPGAERIRLAPREVAQQTWLVNNLGPSDAFGTITSLGSLYFWTEKEPPTYFIVGPTTVFLTEHEQRGIIEALEAAERPYFCMWLFGRIFWRLDPGFADQPLGKYLATSYLPFAQAGQYRIFVHKKVEPRSVRETLLFAETSFDGESDRILLPPGRFDGIPQTFAMWLKTDSGGVALGQQRDGYAGSHAKNGVPTIYIGDDGLLRADLSGGTVAPMTSTEPVNDDAWHWIVVASSSAGRVLYVDGVPVASTTSASAEKPFAFAQVGAGFSDEASGAGAALSYFSGSLADVSIWHRLLSQAEIGAIYRNSIEVGQGEAE